MVFSLTLGYSLIVLGFLLLAVDLFLPSGGVVFVLALVCIAVGVGFTFHHSLRVGVITLIGVFIALPIAIVLLLQNWPRTPMGRRLVMRAPDEETSVLPSQRNLEPLRGRIGKTLSSLRPAGVVDIDGHRVDALTEGTMIDPGQLVRCIDVRAGRVVVRLIEQTTQVENTEPS